MAQGFRARSPRGPPISAPLKNTPIQGSRPMPMAIGISAPGGRGPRSSSCARHCMITRRTPITGNGPEKRRCFRASNCPPLPTMSSRRAPDSGPLTFRSEISQGIARCRVGNFCVDQKEKSARLAKGRASSDDHAAHRFCPKQQRSTYCVTSLGACVLWCERGSRDIAANCGRGC